MARETITIQCYPSDYIVNERIKRYEAFGWELVGNQRCQEYDGQTKEDGTTINHYSTFNKLTFSREKSSWWYGNVVPLESQCNEREKEIDRLNDLKPSEPVSGRWTKLIITCSVIWTIAFGIMALLYVLMDAVFGNYSSSDCSGQIIAYSLVAALGVLVLILLKVRKTSKKKKYKENCAKWRAKYSAQITSLEQECNFLMAEALKYVNTNG